MKVCSDLTPGKYVLLQVSDTGHGIEPDLLEHIFEPFFTTKPEGEGTGLGLSVVHGIIKKMNGIITVSSEINRGTTFNVILPVTGSGSFCENVDKGEIIGGMEKVILVDDEKSIRNSIHEILLRLGYRVTAFELPQKALDSIKNAPQNCDIIITDYSMPQMTGLELAREIKSICPDIPIIMSSGFLNEEKRELSLQAGISEILGKPVNTYELAKTIRKILDEKQKQNNTPVP